tara:strand:+ start:40495 stop:42225 length:1731 start_codon:yes stop_codon:yes gene_type:complete
MRDIYVCGILKMKGKRSHSEVSVESVEVESKTEMKTNLTTAPKPQLVELDEVEHILRAQGGMSTKIGTNIASRNPDVEIAALVMKDVPVTMESFRELASGNDWYRFPFMVLQVGPPGFSTVPYTSTKKKGEKDEGGLPLYEMGGGDENWMTMFHTFEKGKTNKDRGKRMSYVSKDAEASEEAEKQGGCEMQSVTVTMQPGQCMAHFLRSDDFMGKFFVDNAETLSKMRVVPAFSVVYFQVSSANVEQAKHGRMLKFKKMKVLPSKAEELSVLQASVPYLPMNREEFKDVNLCNEARNWSMRENMEKGNLCITICDVSKEAFVTDGEPAVMVGFDVGVGEGSGTSNNAVIEERSLSTVLPHASRRDRLKYLNIAIACGGLKVLLRSNMQGDVVMDCNGEGFAYKVVGLLVDVNKVFGFPVLGDVDLGNAWVKTNDRCFSEHCLVSKINEVDGMLTVMRDVGGDFAWAIESSTIVSEGRKHRIMFCLSSTEAKEVDLKEEGETLPESLCFVDKGCSGSYYEVKVLIVEANQFKNLVGKCKEGQGCPDLKSQGGTCLSVELRPGNRVSAGGKFKRMCLF